MGHVLIPDELHSVDVEMRFSVLCSSGHCKSSSCFAACPNFHPKKAPCVRGAVMQLEVSARSSPEAAANASRTGAALSSQICSG